MPSSGSRSGTKPSRSARGAGSGKLEPEFVLTCGHPPDKIEPVAVYPGGKKRWWCAECHALRGGA